MSKHQPDITKPKDSGSLYSFSLSFGFWTIQILPSSGLVVKSSRSNCMAMIFSYLTSSTTMSMSNSLAKWMRTYYFPQQSMPTQIFCLLQVLTKFVTTVRAYFCAINLKRGLQKVLSSHILSICRLHPSNLSLEFSGGYRQVQELNFFLSYRKSPVQRNLPKQPSRSTITAPAQWLASKNVAVAMIFQARVILVGSSSGSTLRQDWSLGNLLRIRLAVICEQQMGPQDQVLLKPRRWSEWIWVSMQMYLLKGFILPFRKSSMMMLVKSISPIPLLYTLFIISPQIEGTINPITTQYGWNQIVGKQRLLCQGTPTNWILEQTILNKKSMQTEEDFNFGVTLDNGDENKGGETKRQLNRRKNKPNPTKSQASVTNSNGQPNLIPTSSDDYALSGANHPKVCIATIFFKIAAFFVYFFLGYALSNVLTFIFTVILGSLDFWVVKNISGRLLVGLRWWTDEDQKGKQIWKFQTHGQNFQVNNVDQSFFWTSQIVGTLVWGLLLLINILQLDLFWVLLIGINFGFYSTNLYGYYMCRGEHKKRIGNLKDQIGKAGLMRLAGSFM